MKVTAKPLDTISGYPEGELIEFDTVFADGPFSRKVTKDDFEIIGRHHLDSVSTYDLTQSEKTNSLRLIPKEVFDKNLKGIPISLNYSYTKILFDSTNYFYQVDFTERPNYWLISVLENGPVEEDGFNRAILYSLVFDKDNNFIDCVITGFYLSYWATSENWTRLVESDSGFIVIKERIYLDDKDSNEVRDYYRSADSVVVRIGLDRKGKFISTTLDSVHKIIRN